MNRLGRGDQVGEVRSLGNTRPITKVHSAPPLTDAVEKVSGPPASRNNRIVEVCLLNQCCASEADLESILLREARKIFFQQHRPRAVILNLSGLACSDLGLSASIAWIPTNATRMRGTFEMRHPVTFGTRSWRFCDLYRGLNQGRLPQLSGRVATAVARTGVWPIAEVSLATDEPFSSRKKYES
jgi:hypothetical protein